MSKVIMYSKVFPPYHPQAGLPTYFVEKIWKGLWDMDNVYDIHLYQDPHDQHFHPWGKDLKNVHQFTPKFQTIRSGNRWKVGDTFSPRVWSGKPYRSKQIIIAPDIEVKKIWGFRFTGEYFMLDEKTYWGETEGDFELLEQIGENDGLNRHDLVSWLKSDKPFTGQIICWNENIEYSDATTLRGGDQLIHGLDLS